MVYETRLRPPERQSPDLVEAQWLKVARALDAVEARWMAYLAGPLDAAQIALACALGYLDFRHGRTGLARRAPVARGLGGAVRARPSMQATQPPA